MKLKLSKKQVLLMAMSFVAVVAVVGFWLWGRSASAEDYMTAKIEKGNIRQIEAIMERAPYGMPSGWSNWEDGLSDRARDATK